MKKDDLGITICHLQGESDLSDDTSLYRYLPTESFLFLLNFSRLTFTKISNWPDSYEGSRYSFFRRVDKFEDTQDLDVGNFYASCWSLQQEERCLYQSDKEYQDALSELKKNGSAAMWENYCKNGGVRIRTTLGKIRRALSENEIDGDFFRGRTFYEPENCWKKSMNTVGLASTLLHKRISFRYESEYRFLISKKENKSRLVYCEIQDLFDFIDEILISPATPNNKWISRTLYRHSVNFGKNNNWCFNSKEGRQFCRISQLYSSIDETINYLET